MSLALLPLVLGLAAANNNVLPTDNQMPDFKKSTNGPIGVLKTGSGASVDVRDTRALNSNLINNEYFMDEFQSLVRSRIPERMVHAQGVGGFGYFVVTNDITKYCKAKVFSKIGKKTPVVVRMSVTRSRPGIPDATQGSRGCAFKWYTEDGNFDLTGFGVPLSPSKDPARFLGIISTLKENPVTNLYDANMRWDFVVQNPEIIMKTMYDASDYGAPVSYKDMPCHPVHTYQVYNKEGVSSFMRFHLIPCGGSKFLNGTESGKVASGDPHYYSKGFYNDIATGNYPCYDLKAQILSDEDRENADMDIFDVTKILDETQYPFVQIGKVIVNRNVQNYHQDTELAAFCPGNVVCGILGAPDKIYEARRFVYRDAQIYRAGSNFKNIPVNCPINGPVHNYIRDGVSPNNRYWGSGPTYYPNIFNGPVAVEEKNKPQMIQICEKPANNFKQAGHFYRKVLTPSQRTTLINNIIKDIRTCTLSIKKQAIKHFKVIDFDFGKRVAKGLGCGD